MTLVNSSVGRPPGSCGVRSQVSTSVSPASVIAYSLRSAAPPCSKNGSAPTIPVEARHSYHM